MELQSAMVMNRNGEILITGENWEIPNTYTLTSSGSGDYTTATEAFAALTAGDVLLVDAGAYETSGDVVAADVTVFGMGPANTYFYSNNNQSTLFLSSGAYLHNIGVRNGYTFTAGGCVSLFGTITTPPTLRNVQLVHTGHTNGYAIDATKEVYLRNCYLSSTSGKGVKMGASGVLHMFGGHIQAADEAIDNSSAGTVNIYGVPRLIGTMTGNCNGAYLDSNGVFTGCTDFVVDFEERASAPTTPSANRWRLYAKTDGLWVVDDAGAETGPLGSGDPFFRYTRW